MTELSIWNFKDSRFTADELLGIQMRPYRCPACLGADTFPVLEEVTTFGDDIPMYVTECWIKCSRCHVKWQPPPPEETDVHTDSQ